MTTHPNTQPSPTPTAAPEGVQPEIRTQRLVVTDDQGRPCITGEVVNGTTEFRLDLPAGVTDRGSVLLYANSGDDADTGPSLGVQLWAEGEALVEANLWRDGRRWRAGTYVAPGAEFQPE